MKIIGLTGNIGSGKSTVAEIFRTLGVPVYHADAESKQLLSEPGTVTELIRLFGPKVVTSNGVVDRAGLGKIVFADRSALQQLNELMHPKVMEHFRHWIARQSAPYIIHEAAILFESGYASLFDKVICVSCPMEMAVERVTKRDGIPAEAVIERMRHQIPDEKKSAMADFVIINDGRCLLIPQTLAIHNELSEIGPQGKN